VDNKNILTLAIESSCDETAVAIFGVKNDPTNSSDRKPEGQGLVGQAPHCGRELVGQAKLHSSVVSSQIELHRPHGGVVPELASRHHATNIRPVVEQALKEAKVSLNEIDLFAATSGPGLASALLIGNTFAKTLALAEGKPYLAVNTGKMLGLPYPGGPEIEKQAQSGDPKSFSFPQGLTKPLNNLDFSFSGLKTAVLYTLSELNPESGQAPPDQLPNLCASIQHAITEVLIKKSLYAAKENQLKLITLSGGVSCNQHLCQAFTTACSAENLNFLACSRQHSTDNAAMIAFTAFLRHQHLHGETSPLDQGINPNQSLVNL